MREWHRISKRLTARAEEKATSYCERKSPLWRGGFPHGLRRGLPARTRQAGPGIAARNRSAVTRHARLADRNGADRTRAPFRVNQSWGGPALSDWSRFEFWVHSTANCTRVEAESRLSLALSFSR